MERRFRRGEIAGIEGLCVTKDLHADWSAVHVEKEMQHPGESGEGGGGPQSSPDVSRLALGCGLISSSACTMSAPEDEMG